MSSFSWLRLVAPMMVLETYQRLRHHARAGGAGGGGQTQPAFRNPQAEQVSLLAVPPPVVAGNCDHK